MSDFSRVQSIMATLEFFGKKYEGIPLIKTKAFQGLDINFTIPLVFDFWKKKPLQYPDRIIPRA